MKLQIKLRYAVAALAAVAFGGLAFAWSGLYNVAASDGHFAFVDVVLRFGMRNSVEAHASGIQAPNLADDDMIKLGGAHFERGCRACHGGPGVAHNPIMQQTLPPAPNLTTRIAGWRDRELFWIVKHGLKYTAMPGWTAQDRDDEVWAVVAFLRRLPNLDDQSYAELAGVRTIEKPTRLDPAGPGDLLSVERGCAVCHGRPASSPTNALTPALQGQTPQMISEALKAYATGSRPSGIMQPVASQLQPSEIRKLASEYAAAVRDGAFNGSTDVDQNSDGKTLFEEGDPANNIPACKGCHNAQSLPSYPRLAGLHARYVSGQLRLWKKGGRRSGELAAIMASIATKLSDQQVDDVSDYIATLPRLTSP